MAISGISKENVNSLCLEVQDYAEKLQIILNQIDAIFANSKSSFQGDVAPEFYNKYEILHLSYKTVNENILSYIDDFHTLVNNFVEQDKEMSTRVEKRTIELLEERRD